MALDYAGLQAELLAGHPDTGAYDADDALAAGELNALNRPVLASGAEIREFCLYTLHNEGTGSDTQNANIYGRIEMIAEAKQGDDPFGVTDSLEVQQIAAAKTFLYMLNADDFQVLLADTEFDAILTKLQGANAFSPADKTALQALADNKQNRVTEIGFGRTQVNADHVAFARAL